MSDHPIGLQRRDALVLALGSAISSLPVLSGKAQAGVPVHDAGTRRIAFDQGWRFYRGGGEGFAATAFDDSAWRSVDLPHDWSVEDVPASLSQAAVGPFDKRAIGRTATGFAIGGEGWYRKSIDLDDLPADARLELALDGAYLETEIWLNGQSLKTNVNGYIPFAVDLTPALDRAGKNILAIHVRNEGRNSRWYSGSGLYRSIELIARPSGSRIAPWGVGAWTRRLAKGAAEISVTTELELVAPDQQLITRLRDENGMVVAQASSKASSTTSQSLTVRGPRLWSPDQPQLYQLETVLQSGDRTIDRLEQPFGVRIISFDARRGMTLNGARFALRGGCVHHDNGLLGACAYPDADERRIRLLKARGFNAIRSSHNPASRSLRDACDRLGMLLIEEAFDVWHSAKEPEDFSTQFEGHWEEVLEAMVRSARNSPSVIMWSIGNEIPYRATDEGVKWQWRLANAVRQMDPTRPVTAGLNGVLGAPMVADADTARTGQAGKVDNASTIFLDVPGYNYRLEDIEAEQQVYPDRVVYASETFARDLYDYKALSDRAPYFLGEFLWTAMDYLGEAGLGATAQLKDGSFPIYMPAYPWVNAWCGDIDLIGQQKASSLARDVLWGMSPLEISVQRPIAAGKFEYVANWGWPDELQSWTWPGSEGRVLSVRVHCAGDRVELRLNGAVVGTRALTKSDGMRCEFKLPYAAGVLEAVGYRGGQVIGRRTLRTVGTAAAIRLRAERDKVPPGPLGLHYLVVEVVDQEGHVLPDEQRSVRLTLEGTASLLAFGSANPLATGSLQARETQTFRGRAMAIFRSLGSASDVRVEMTSEGLEGATAQLRFVN